METSTEPEKQDWRHYLAGGFAFTDAPFASHPLDQQRARKMFFAALREGATIDDIKVAAKEYLDDRSWNPSAILEEIKRVERFVKSIKPAQKKNSAWLIMWETMGEELPYSKRIIAIRDGRTSPERIKEFVEQFYISTSYSLSEKMHYSSHAKDNPYPAEYLSHPKGGRWTGGITCGHNPFVLARFVRKLKIYIDDENEPALSWEKVKPR